MSVEMPRSNVLGSRRSAPVVSHSAVLVQAVPSQFGGEVIELAALVSILALVTAVSVLEGSLDTVWRVMTYPCRLARGDSCSLREGLSACQPIWTHSVGVPHYR